MDGAQLESFLAVVRYGTIKDASLHLDLAPSTITTRLQVLEQRLGVVLIDRGRGRARSALTPEGEEFLELAERWEAVTRDMASLVNRGDAALVIGAPDSVNHYLLAPVYSDLVRRNAGLILKSVTANSADLYGKIQRREVDVAFVLYDRHIPGVRTQHFISEPMLAITRRDVSGTESGVIDLAQLDAEQQIHIPWGDQIERWDSARPTPFCGSIWVDTAHQLTAFLADERKWALVPGSLADALEDRGAYNVYRIADPPPNRVVFQARRDRLSQLALRGCELFDEAIRRLLPHVHA